MDELSDRADAAGVPGQQMRAGGFLLTAVGALVAGIGSMLDWVTVALASAANDVSPTDRGVDLVEGLVALGLAVVALVAVLASRIGRTGSGRRAAAAIVLVAGIGMVAIVGLELATSSRFVDDAIEEIAADRGLSSDELPAEMRDELERVLEFRPRIGIWVTLAGGLMMIGGGLLTLAWTARHSHDAEDISAPRRPDEG